MIERLEISKDTKLLISNSCKQELKFFNSANIEIEITNNSIVNLINVLDLLDNNLETEIDIKVLNGCKLIFDNFDKTDKEVNFKLNVFLEEGAETVVRNVVLAKESSHNYKVEVVNCSRKSKGNIIQKGVAREGSHVTLNAVSRILKDARSSENFQESTVLLLDDASLGEASPLLYIDNEDVVAGHKAKVSRVDEENVYYLQSRGIEKLEAENLLIDAFVKSTVDEMEV